MKSVNDQPEMAQPDLVVKQETKHELDELTKQENGAAAGELVSDEALREKLLLLLADSDLATTTEKMLRGKLEAELGVKLGDRKALIRDEVLAFLAKKREEEALEGEGEDEGPEGEEVGEEEEGPRPKKRRTGGGFGTGLSEQLQEFLGVESMPRPQVVKAIWAYIRENSLQEPSDKRKIIVDEKLSKFFTPPVDIFSMNKQLSKHCFVIDSVAPSSIDEPKQRPAKKPKTSSSSSSKPPANGKSKESGKSKGDGEKQQKASGFTKPLRLSDELAAATGQKEMSRGAVTKWLYEYAKQKDLMDPSNKQYVLSDETLKNLTGETRFRAFGSGKLFSKHFLK